MNFIGLVSLWKVFKVVSSLLLGVGAASFFVARFVWKPLQLSNNKLKKMEDEERKARDKIEEKVPYEKLYPIDSSDESNGELIDEASGETSEGSAEMSEISDDEEAENEEVENEEVENEEVENEEVENGFEEVSGEESDEKSGEGLADKSMDVEGTRPKMETIETPNVSDNLYEHLKKCVLMEYTPMGQCIILLLF